MRQISLTQISVEELQNMIKEAVKTELAIIKNEKEHIVRGYQGLADYLHCGKTKAYELLKSGQIDEAVSQSGRTILIDANKVKQILKIG